MKMPQSFFKYTYILGASGSRQDRKQHLTVQGVVATFGEPKEWIKEKVQDEVATVYKNAFNRFARHRYNLVEIDGEEMEEIERHEAPGYYYLNISTNDTPVKRIRLFREKESREYQVFPKSEAGHRHILDVLSSAAALARRLLGF